MTIDGKTLEGRAPSKLFLRMFMTAYFCAGVGYVASTIFSDIVSLMLTKGQRYPPVAWPR
ncbi:hypothetical protein [Thiosocius teredinicola]|uniref:hypothetical protein n=1 Tax=Thiosocius teredinicola TaxID=1973002 RepID=UPI0009911882